MRGHTIGARAVAFSPDGTLLASSSHGRTIRLWEIATGECLSTLSGHQDWVWALAFRLDGQILAGASEDRNIRLW